MLSEDDRCCFFQDSGNNLNLAAGLESEIVHLLKVQEELDDLEGNTIVQCFVLWACHSPCKPFHCTMLCSKRSVWL